MQKNNTKSGKMGLMNQTLKGFRDFNSSEAVLRNEVMGKIRAVFEKFGFEELQTPALEYQEVLLGKYGPEAEKLMYLFQDPGGRGVGLKYDLTVPLARYVANNRELPLPFKRYQMQPVWRAENTQKGRYREFYQCDVDIIGSNSPLSDAEILAVISGCLNALEFSNYTIQINSRAVLFQIMESLGLAKQLWLTTIQTIDKLDKKSGDEVKEELSQKGLEAATIESLFDLIKTAKPDQFLTDVMELAQKLGATNMKFNPTVSRGLDYYTGPIFETVVHEPKIGSITGGGRYDELLKTLGGPDLPAVGTTIGLERIIDVITELQLWKGNTVRTKALVTVFNAELLVRSVEVVEKLRDKNINAELYLDEAKLEKQLKYADKKNIPYVIVLGPEEVSQNTVQIKNMREGTNQTLSIDEAISYLLSV